MRKYNILVNGNPYDIKIRNMDEDTAMVECNGVDYEVVLVEMENEIKTPKLVRKTANPYAPEKIGDRTHKPGAKVSGAFIKAPIPGLMTEIMVKVGDKVSEGQIVAKMEAMKMENNIQATTAAVVKSIEVKQGDSILEGDVIMTLED